MSDVALINGDIVPSSFGDIMIVNDDDDIIQTAINNILLIYGTNQFHTDIGNMVYHNRNKMTERGLQEVAGYCKDAILQDNRVSEVIEIVARNNSTSDNPGLCGISFILQTIYGRQLNSNVSIIL